MPNSFAGPDQDPVMTQFDRLIAFIVYVLLFIGVFTSVFTAVMVTQVLLGFWFRAAKPKTLPIA